MSRASKKVLLIKTFHFGGTKQQTKHSSVYTRVLKNYEIDSKEYVKRSEEYSVRVSDGVIIKIVKEKLRPEPKRDDERPFDQTSAEIPAQALNSNSMVEPVSDRAPRSSDNNTNVPAAALSPRKKRTGPGAVLCNPDEEYEKLKKDREDSETDVLVAYKRLDDDVKTPDRSLQILQDVSNVANSLVLGIMIRDAISDGLYGRKLAFTKDVAFVASVLLSPVLAAKLDAFAERKLLTNNVLGRLSRVASFGLQRAMTIYIFIDFVNNARKIYENTNDTAAWQGAAVDGAFLAIDAACFAVKRAALGYGLATLAVVVEPVGAILGAGLIVGLNVYQTVKTVHSIETAVDLTRTEKIDEYARAFMHLKVEASVERLINEKRANEQLAQSAAQYLMSRKDADVFVSEAGYVDANGSISKYIDNIIDFRTKVKYLASRATPSVPNDMDVMCQLYGKIAPNGVVGASSANTLREKAEERLIRMKNFFNKKPHLSFGYVCKNSFAIYKHMGSSANASIFQLGDGIDLVYGFDQRPNIFYLNNGSKNVTGGQRSDTFYVTGHTMNGTMNGGLGTDTLDFSSLEHDLITVHGGKMFSSEHGEIEIKLEIDSVERLVGRPQKTDHVICPCGVNRIELGGGKNRTDTDLINIPNIDCFSSLQIVITSNVTIVNNATSGNFSYYITGDDSGRANIQIKGGMATTHKILVDKNLVDFDVIKLIQSTDNMTKIHFSSDKDTVFIHVDNSPDCFTMHFKDGSQLHSINNVISVILNSQLQSRQIVELYADFISKTGLNMMAYSIPDDVTVTFSNGAIKSGRGDGSDRAFHIIHYNPVDEKNHLILGGDENLILFNMNASTIQETNSTSTATFYASGKYNFKTTIDFSPLVEQLQTISNYELYIRAANHGADLILQLFSIDMNGTVLNMISSIYIVDALHNNFIDNLLLVNNADIRINVLNNTIQNRYELPHLSGIVDADNSTKYLIIEPFEFENKQFVLKAVPVNITYQSPLCIIPKQHVHHLEWFHEIRINRLIFNYNMYRVGNQSLLITNAEFSEFIWDTKNVFVVIIEGFFEIPKFQTLKFVTNGLKIDLADHLSDIHEETPDKQKLWAILMRNIKYLNQF